MPSLEAWHTGNVAKHCTCYSKLRLLATFLVFLKEWMPLSKGQELCSPFSKACPPQKDWLKNDGFCLSAQGKQPSALDTRIYKSQFSSVAISYSAEHVRSLVECIQSLRFHAAFWPSSCTLANWKERPNCFSLQFIQIFTPDAPAAPLTIGGRTAQLTPHH